MALGVSLLACLAATFLTIKTIVAGGDGNSHKADTDAVDAFLRKALHEYLRQKSRASDDPLYEPLIGDFSVSKKGGDPRRSVWVKSERFVESGERLTIGFLSLFFFGKDYVEAENFEVVDRWNGEEGVTVTRCLSVKAETLIVAITSKNDLPVKKETTVRRFSNGRAGGIASTWKVVIDEGRQQKVETAAAILRAYFCEVTDVSELEVSHGPKL